MGIRKIGCLLAVCLMVLMSRAYAENMQFVDANGSTGYYVDTDSISSDQVVENDVQKTLWTARVAVIRADLNRRYIYLMQFDPAKRTYQIFASEVQRYDTKDVDVERQIAVRAKLDGLVACLPCFVEHLLPRWQIRILDIVDAPAARCACDMDCHG